jgi:threonine/homoserine/homoserine lactone efflux protein
MDYLSIFLASFTIAFSGALMPGPLLTAVIAESTRGGFKTGPLIILGHALLEALVVLLIILGVAHFIRNTALILTISLTGSLILLVFGIDMLRSLPKLSLNTPSNISRSSNLVLLGITASLSNPYWSIWWLTIGLGLVIASQKGGILAIILFFLGHILADFGWYSVVSWGISQGRKFISLNIYRGIIFICALALIAFSVYFLTGVFEPLR